MSTTKIKNTSWFKEFTHIRVKIPAWVIAVDFACSRGAAIATFGASEQNNSHISG